MRLGVTIEFEGKSYDILELPLEAFLYLIPGLKEDQVMYLSERFTEVWSEPTRRRNHMLEFVAKQAGVSVDELIWQRSEIHFDEMDVQLYIDTHTKQGIRPS